MVSIGTLAAGVAHEINNPLTAIMANLDLASMDVMRRIKKLGLSPEISELKEELEDAHKAAERIRDIVGDLKIFSRARDIKIGPTPVQAVIESTLRMVWNELRHRARLVKDYGETPPVQASETLLGQVLLNLVVNAAHAIPDGNAENNEIRISTGMANGQVVIEVADTGCGIPDNILSKIFIPFFTTKPVGVGTGLGLAICHRIVTDLGGTINVKSAVGVGTSFQVALPIAAMAEREPEPPTDPVLPARRRGKILVIDDEAMILKAISRAFSLEHEVITLQEGEKAFEAIHAGERFDIILCDLMMPQMTGMALHDKILGVAPEQASRMIFLTGGAFTPQAQAFLNRTKNLCIEKPFDTVYLRRLFNERIQ
jgi:signal transduction histidine kinase